MRYAYPVVLDPEPDGSAINVSFPDVPEALTWGDNEAEALHLAEDCLVTALNCYVRAGKPLPSRLRREVDRYPGAAIGGGKTRVVRRDA